jgi:hypothetical protein
LVEKQSILISVAAGETDDLDTKYLDPEFILKILKEIDEIYFVLEEKLPRRYFSEGEEEKIVGKQFIWIHNAKIEREKQKSDEVDPSSQSSTDNSTE